MTSAAPSGSSFILVNGPVHRVDDETLCFNTSNDPSKLVKVNDSINEASERQGDNLLVSNNTYLVRDGYFDDAFVERITALGHDPSTCRFKAISAKRLIPVSYHMWTEPEEERRISLNEGGPLHRDWPVIFESIDSGSTSHSSPAPEDWSSETIFDDDEREELIDAFMAPDNGGYPTPSPSPG